MRSVEIRPGRLDDLEALVLLERRCFAAEEAMGADTIGRFLGVGRGTARVLEVDGQVAGVALLVATMDRGEMRLASIAVDPDLQGEGLGRRLLRDAMEAARDRGARRMILEVRVGNRRAQRLYADEGFDVVDRLEGYYVDGEDALQMARGLGD